MKIKSITFFSLVVLLTSACNVTLLAQNGSAGAFLRLGLGARAKAMGDAFTAFRSGLESSYYNPAGLPFLENKEVIVSYRLLSLDRQYTFVGFGVPLQPKIAGSNKQTLDGGFALAWIHAGVGDIDARDSNGRHVDDVGNSENAFIFAFALKPAEQLAVGLSVKIVLNRFPDIGIDGQTISANGVGFDFGVLYSPVDWLTLGATIRDVNTKYRWNTDDLFGEDGTETIDHFPKILRTAVAVSPPQLPNLTFAIDFEQFYREKHFQNKLDDRLHLGVEGSFRENIVLRGGLDDGSFTAGGGYEFDVFGNMAQLNYAFISPGDRPEGEHIFTWVFQF